MQSHWDGDHFHPTKSFVVSLELRENDFCTLPSFWFEWTSPYKSWLLLDDLCGSKDMEFFTFARFLHWKWWDRQLLGLDMLGGRGPKTIVSLIYLNQKVAKDQIWPSSQCLDWAHRHPAGAFCGSYLVFVEHSALLEEVVIHLDSLDSIAWKLATHNS
jgi:hypothetical protein